MATTALQVDFLISGCRDNVGAVNDSGKVFFFSAGTTTTKAVYSDKAQTAYDTVTASASPHSGEEYVTLDSNGFPNAEAGGLAEVYADGTYDVYVYNSADVLQYTLSSVTYVVPATTAVTASYHTSGPVTPDGTTQVYYFDTTAGNIAANISVDASSLSAGTYITFIIVNGSNSVTITPNGSGTIAGESTWTISGANTVCRIESDGTNDDWGIANVATHTHADIENGGATLTTPTITTPKIDTINEETAAAGVTVDGCLIKDSGVTAVIDQNGGTALKCKVIEIGDWNMDSTSQVGVAHGVANFENIRSVSAIIRDDASVSTHTDLSYGAGAGSGFSGCVVATPNIVLHRETSGVFDSTGYDSTSYNRGWVTIWYV